MHNLDLSNVSRDVLAQLADAFAWAGDDRTADAIYADIETADRAAIIAKGCTIIPLFPTAPAA